MKPTLTAPLFRPRLVVAGLPLLVLAACGDGPMFPSDWDLRSPAALSTAEAALNATADRPRADDRGVISYPGYQVVLTRRGETARTVATRLGVSADALARRNAVDVDVPLRAGEVLILADRTAEPTVATGAAPTGPLPATDIAAIATTALDRPATGTGATTTPVPPRPVVQSGREPTRHRVAKGETAFGVARRYNVPVQALADWNGLGTDLSLREGQTLLIPPFAETPPPAGAATTPPGSGSATPVPPSATAPLPRETAPPTATATAVPPSPDLGAGRTGASASRFAMPADGPIIRAYVKGKNNGIGIGAPAGSPVRAAADGTVAAITTTTERVPIIVIRHPDNLLTVYANVDPITVAKDATVRRGQQIGRVMPGSPAFLHFEVSRGTERIDPTDFLK